MVGPSGSGKSMAWRVLLKALERLEGIEGVSYVIDPKAISKVKFVVLLKKFRVSSVYVSRNQIMIQVFNFII